MGLTANKTLYKAIALISSMVLIGLLTHLTYNTFVLSDQQYQNTDKMLIKEYYGQSIRNDKLYPGGQAIIDSCLNGETLRLLDSLHRQKSERLNSTIDSLSQRLIQELRQNNTMDTVFENIKNLYRLGEKWEYALLLNHLKIALPNGQEIGLYEPMEDNSNVIKGIRIGGKLSIIKQTNLASNLIVSSTADYSHEISFALYADRSDRNWMIVKLVAPIFLFGLTCVIAIIVIYFLTYKNWLRQKRLAEMKSDFVNSITHEFHTPISTILVANKNLQNNPQVNSSPIVSSISSIIERQAVRLQRLFSQVLDITSMGGYALQKEEVNLQSFLSNIITDYKLSIKDDNTTIEFNTGDIHADVELNPFFFTTMIVNLLENAIKHNSKDKKTVSIELHDKGKNIEITVSDNGEGIANKEVAHIFKKFHRSGYKKTDGLGLGLYYVKQCVQSHGWSMNVRSEEHVGTRFILTIPKNKNK